jgi:hypothetical protein
LIEFTSVKYLRDLLLQFGKTLLEKLRRQSFVFEMRLERALLAHDFSHEPSADQCISSFANFVGSPSFQLLLIPPVVHCDIKLYNFSTRREFQAECFFAMRSEFPSLHARSRA